MPSHPPDTTFYSDPATYTLWRDLTRMYEDFVGEDESQWEEKRKRFEIVMNDILSLLTQAKAA